MGIETPRPPHIHTTHDAPLRSVAMHGEPDRYLAATLAARPDQSGLIALAAFAAEIGRIPSLVSEPALGQIRLQWWRDALENGVKGQTCGHPVADAFVAALVRAGIGLEWPLEMIDARELDLAGAISSNDAGLFAYLDKIEGNAFRLTLSLLGAQEFNFAEPAGRAFGLARALGRLPMLHHNGGFPLPADRLRDAGADPADLATSPVPEDAHKAVDRVTGDLRQYARRELEVARAAFRDLPKRLRPALLPLAMVEPYLKSQSVSRTLETVSEPGALLRVVRIGFAHLAGRV